MSKFAIWWITHVDEITWWVIGWCSFACFDQLLKGNWIFAALNALLVVINYKTWRDNRV